MFGNCFRLKGDKGTAYLPMETNGWYAHIDGGRDNPGYLSTYASKSPKAVVYYATDDILTTLSPFGNALGRDNVNICFTYDSYVYTPIAEGEIPENGDVLAVYDLWNTETKEPLKTKLDLREGKTQADSTLPQWLEWANEEDPSDLNILPKYNVVEYNFEPDFVEFTNLESVSG